MLMLCLSTSVWGQKIKEFSTDPAEFISQLQAEFTASKKSKAIAALNEFVSNQQSGAVSDAQIKQINSLFNEMLSKRYRISPHFENYFKSVNSLVAKGWMNKFDSWHKLVEALIKRAKKGEFNEYKHFLEFSTNYFATNQLTKQGNKSYGVEGDSFSFLLNGEEIEVQFKDIDLKGASAKDSLMIYKTSATYFPLKYLWKGNKGTVTWERNGLDANQVYAELDAYEFDLKKGEYSCKEVVFYYKEIFDKALKGDLKDKFSAPMAGKYIYPQFESYANDLVIDKLIPQISMKGGFKLEGRDILGVGTNEKPARMTFSTQDGKKVMNAYSNIISIKNNQEVNSAKTKTSIYFENDSIYHPNLDLFYDGNTQNLRLVRGEKASSKASYVDSYHTVVLDVDGIYWNLNEPVLNFKMVQRANVQPVRVESFNYYNKGVVESYLVTSEYNPIQKLANWFDSTRDPVLSAEDFARYIKGQYTVESIRTVIVDLVEDGFILFDPETNMITILEKAIHYDNAMKKKVDYDNILLNSMAKQENAQLDLENNELLVTGVERVMLSDSQNVVFFPDRKMLRLLKDRDMLIDGGLSAGMIDFGGKDFAFKYQNFKVEMDSTDRMQLYVPPLDAKKRHDNPSKIMPIRTIIEDVTGVLYVDKPHNKSGLEDYPEYPIFDATGNSFIYYDSKKLYEGAYNRQEFYFRLDPFKLEGIDRVEASQLVFPGIMHYGDIFPDLEQTAVLKEDLTIGFSDELTGKNTPAYKATGVFNGSVDLSISEGLRGKGQMDFLSTSVYAQDFVFFPDSMNTVTDSVSMVQKSIDGISFPQMRAKTVKLHWIPYADSMLLKMMDTPFDMYNREMRFKGNMLVSSKGLKGKGKCIIEQGTIMGSEFTFEGDAFEGAQTSLTIKATGGKKKNALEATGFSTDVDWSAKTAVFEAESDTINIEMPLAQFRSNSSRIDWDLEKGEVTVSAGTGKLPTFTSLKEEQKGLQFEAEKAVLDVAENTLNIEGVGRIFVGDAGITPENQSFDILSDAKINQLKNAEIVTDLENEYHKISGATVDITSSEFFFGFGDYNYTNAVGTQLIKMDSLYTRNRFEDIAQANEAARLKKEAEKAAAKEAKQDAKEKKKDKKAKDMTIDEIVEEEEGKKEETEEKKEPAEKESAAEEEETKKEKKKKSKKEEGDPYIAYTYGSGQIPMDQNFKLDETLLFKGDVKLDSKEPQLTFKGFAKIDLQTDEVDSEWFSFEDDIDPNNITLVLEDPVSENKDSLYVGISYNPDEMEVYSTFLNVKKSKVDRNIFQASGALEYQEAEKSYRIASEDKIAAKTRVGNVFSLYDREEIIKGEGELFFGENYGLLEAKTAGTIIHDLNADTISLEDVGIALNFHFDKKILESMAADIKGLAAENDEVTYQETGFATALGGLLKEKGADAVLNKIIDDDYFDKPKSFDPTLFLCNVDMVWDTLNQTFRSAGKFGVSHIGDAYINRMVDGYIEFGPRRSGDYFHIYIELEDVETSSKEWYYLYYKNSLSKKDGTESGILHMVSSNPSFNDNLAGLSPKKKMQKVDKEDPRSFEFTLASMFKKTNFMSRMFEIQDRQGQE